MTTKSSGISPTTLILIAGGGVLLYLLTRPRAIVPTGIQAQALLPNGQTIVGDLAQLANSVANAFNSSSGGGTLAVAQP